MRCHDGGAFCHTSLAIKGKVMKELIQILQDKRDWLTSTTGAKHVSVKLDASQLARIMSALGECENPALPKIESRMLA